MSLLVPSLEEVVLALRPYLSLSLLTQPVAETVLAIHLTMGWNLSLWLWMLMTLPLVDDFPPLLHLFLFLFLVQVLVAEWDAGVAEVGDTDVARNHPYHHRMSPLPNPPQHTPNNIHRIRTIECASSSPPFSSRASMADALPMAFSSQTASPRSQHSTAHSSPESLHPLWSACHTLSPSRHSPDFPSPT